MTTSQNTSCSLPDPVEVAAQHIQNEQDIGKADSIQATQSKHRLRLIDEWTRQEDGTNDWTILKGNVLDLGCGQGDQTGALAAVMASIDELKQSKVFGVDPGSPDYGCPFTLQQAQDQLKRSQLFGSYIDFQTQIPGPQALSTGDFSTVVLSHCIWYFKQAQGLSEIFEAAKKANVKKILIAEWCLSISDDKALPHLLSAILQAQAPLDGGNIQNTLTPVTITRLANQAGWKVEKENIITPDPRLQDGRWETFSVKDAAKNFLEKQLVNSAQAVSVEALKFAFDQALKKHGNQVQSMDIWTCVLTLA